MDQEDVLQKHRQERKELQAKITALKKTIPKNDKKKKKEISDIAAKLEEELNEKHKQELDGFEKSTCETNQTDDVCDTNNSEGDGDANNCETNGEGKDDTKIKMSRAQRRRNKKETEDKERNKRIVEQEKINRHGPKTLELNAINEVLGKEGLQIYQIPADGNCLYCAVKHQLEITDRDDIDVEHLRKLTATFMLDNKDDFLPFMCNDSEEPVGDEQFEKYCKEVASTKLWGGQLELRALSNVLQCPIKVIQASGPATVQGEQFIGKPLILTYHRHLYRLGEHYNSTVAISDSADVE